MIIYKLDFAGNSDDTKLQISLKEVLQYLKQVNIEPDNIDLVITTISNGYDGSHEHFELEYVEKTK